MIWMTFWPLVLGFSLSGLIQSGFKRDALQRSLGHNNVVSVSRASVLGVISSSCSYAASAMAKALFSRGASWTNSLVFMVASTNLVIELGVVLYVFLGGRFVLAQLLGGVVMIVLLVLLTPLFFKQSTQDQLRNSFEQSPNLSSSASASPGNKRDTYLNAARFTMGDLTMVRRELFIGFLVAGFLSAHVSPTIWSHIFFSGHGNWTLLENVLVSPLIAVVSFVCSVGNIPFAAALWQNGSSFGGVISFIFADLITLPLLLIYRSYFGVKSAVRLFALLYLVMASAGFLVQLLFNATGAVPKPHHLQVAVKHFEMGSTLVLNCVSMVMLIGVWRLSKMKVANPSLATDPICGMSVPLQAPAAVRTTNGVTTYFCSEHCAKKFDRGEQGDPMVEDLSGDQVDPICAMRVSSKSALHTVGPDGLAYYFCSNGCRQAFIANPGSGARQQIQLGRKPSNE